MLFALHVCTLVRCSPPPCAGEAVFARCLSSLKDERVRAGKKLKGPQKTQFEGDKKSFLEDIRKVGVPGSILVGPLGAVGVGLLGENTVGPQGGGERQSAFLSGWQPVPVSLSPRSCSGGIRPGNVVTVLITTLISLHIIL